MDLISPHPFWLIQNGLVATYPPLDRDETCDVLIIGAGVTGALIADLFTAAGLDVVMLDRRDVAQGSTAASTGLLQYEIDVHLTDLIQKVGLESAQRAYRLCLGAIDELDAIAQSLPDYCGFARKQSLYAASRARDVASLQQEHDARVEAGINVEYLPEAEVRSRFHVDFPAALLSADAAVVDAYRLTHGLLKRVCERGGRIFDRTEVTKIDESESQVRVTTDRGGTVTARELVHATGYEVTSVLKERIVNLKSTYAAISQPLDSVAPWDENCLLWETARPYLYLRTTEDRRLLFGGADDAFRNPSRRDARVGRKAGQLARRVRELFPDLAFDVEFAWAGTFGETADGLAYIGRSPEHPHSLFALGFGGNGITFSVIAARILLDLVLGRENPDAEIFRFGR